MTNDASHSSETPPSRPAPLRLAMRIVADFGVTIAVPAIVATLIGVRLDRKWESEPAALIVLLIIAFLSTAVWIVRKAKRYKQEYEQV